jgi:hypothetical protein
VPTEFVELPKNKNDDYIGIRYEEEGHIAHGFKN